MYFISLICLIACVSVYAENVSANSAYDFIHSIGVNTHWNAGSYESNRNTLKTKLANSGIKNMRDSRVAGKTDALDRATELFNDAGIKTLWIVQTQDSNGLRSDQIDDEVNAIKNNVPPASILAFEGPNEWDLQHSSGDTNWASDLYTYQGILYNFIKADPQLASLPVLSPSLTSDSARADTGEMDDRIDFVNTHYYQGTKNPGTNEYPVKLDRLFNQIIPAVSASEKPAWSTECGWRTNDPGTGKDISETVQGKYIPRMLAEFYRRGVAKTFQFELFDADSSGHLTFGLIRNNLSEKPSYKAVKSILNILDDSVDHTPSSLRFSLSGDTANVKTLVLQKSNGVFCVLIWIEKSNWDYNNETEISINDQYPTLTLEEPVEGILYHKIDNNGNVWGIDNVALDSNNSVSLRVRDRISVLEITPMVGMNQSVRLYNKWSGKYLRATGTTDSGPVLHESVNAIWTSPKWYLEDAGDGWLRFQNLWSNKYLRAQGTTYGGTISHEAIYAGWSSPQWDIEYAGNGYYHIVNKWTGKYLKATGSTFGGEVRHEALNASDDAFLWKIESSENAVALSMLTSPL